MDPFWQKVEVAVAQASEMTGTEFRSWLAEFCSGNEKLKSEIESFLSLQSQLGNFLESPVGIRSLKVLSETETDYTDRLFGNYQIIREIGHGGMGAVFLAKRIDGEFQQEVAIKIVRQAIAESELINRFKRERQILASLNHPNIAKLLDGGVSEGMPFLAMEFIDGETISCYAGKNSLDVDSRLRLFLKVCSAVSYAHQNLVVHRDLKPSNILIDAEGEPKLLDFGLAKLLDDNILSDSKHEQSAFRALTPAYASPEQLKGEQMNTMSDIYSLGIVLYELLANQRPYNFEGKSFEQIVSSVSDSTPAPPSANSQSLPLKANGDLDNIVLMALRKEPERRYQSVADFAADIEKYLLGLPISARPNTLIYRAEKFFSRNRYMAAMAAFASLLTLIGVGSVFWQAQRAEIQRSRAEKRFAEVRKMSNSLMFEIHDSVEVLEGSTPTRQLIVSVALEYLDSLFKEIGDDPGLQIELATAYQKVGEIQGNPYSANLGDTAGAMNSYRNSLLILENLNKLHPSVESRLSLGKNYRAIGDILEVEGDVAGCIENYRNSLRIFEDLNADAADRVEVRDELARAYESLGEGLSRMDAASSDILENYEKLLSIRRDLAERNPENRKLRRALAVAYLKVGRAFDATQPEAIENIKKGIAVFEGLSQSDPTNAQARREVGFGYFEMGAAFMKAGKFAEALEVRRQALVIRQKIAEDDPKNKQAQFDLGTAYLGLSEAFSKKRVFSEALMYGQRFRETLEKLSKDDVDNAIFRRNVGVSYENSAAVFESAAQNEKVSIGERLKDWRNSREWYQKAGQVFTDLKNRNKLQPRDDAKIEELNLKIDNCNRSISDLTHRHS